MFIGMGFMSISIIDFIINHGPQLHAAFAFNLPMAVWKHQGCPAAAGEKEAERAQKPKRKLRKRPKGSADDPLGRRGERG